MRYAEQVDALGSNRHQLSRAQVENAVAVCAGEAVLDRELFYPTPARGEETAVEVDGNMTVIKDTIGAFAIGFYAQSYGPASSNNRVKEGAMVKDSLIRWNNGVSDALRAKVGRAAFGKIFFEGGLWHVFINQFDDKKGTLRSALEETTDFRALRKQKYLQQIAEVIRPHFARIPPALEPSHEGSHPDAARFANTVLDIGEKEFGIKHDDDREALLDSSLPELSRPATRYDLEGVNTSISDFCIDPQTLLFKRKFITIADRPHVGFNMEAIEEHLQKIMPGVTSHNHRGCPAIYQKTPYKGKKVPIFTAMNRTLTDIYRESGALSQPGLRPIPTKKLSDLTYFAMLQ